MQIKNINKKKLNKSMKNEKNKVTSLRPLKYLILALYIMLNSANGINGQNTRLSEFADISILTCSPGDELYSTFGHTGIRVKDPENNLDIVFNYGTFNFNEPYFYLKFARGLLNYALAIQQYEHFYISYEEEDRAIIEQVLSLSYEEKNVLFEALMTNAKPENREYKYHFFFDNCATRVRDIIDNNIHGALFFDKTRHVQEMSFRDAIAVYLANKPWTKFGLNLILGRPTDDMVNEYTIQFLPDYLKEEFHTARRIYGNSRIVMAENQLLKAHKTQKKQYVTPFIVLTVMSIIVLLITRYEFIRNKCAHWLNFIVFAVPGLLGVLILFLWFLTSHTVTGPNWHIIWASPLLLGFLFLNKYNTFYKYFTIFLFSCQVFCLAFFTLFDQYFPPALIPVWIMILIRIFLKYSEIKYKQVKKMSE